MLRREVPAALAREAARVQRSCTEVAKRRLQFFGKFSATFRSFSAVSAPIFATKYAFFSIFQNLPDYPAENFEIWQYFANFATFAKFLLNFHKNC